MSPESEERARERPWPARLLRNVALIAHVDHGKTTLVDAILRQTGAFRENQAPVERILDSNELERERGITILAKNTAVFYSGHKINLVDTPGHADFGGEVERVLGMVDGALVLVDAAEGVMPQTRFVVEKALKARLRLILVVNKIDRAGADPARVIDQVLDLLIALGADEESVLELPVLYAAGRLGVVRREPPRRDAEGRLLEELQGDVQPLLETILERVPPPSGDPDAPLQLLVTSLDRDEYLGRLAIGRIANGRLRDGQGVAVVRGRSGHPPRPGRVQPLFTFGSLRRLRAGEAEAGEIVALAGLEGVTVGETVTDALEPKPLPPLQVDEPTMTMVFMVNTSPFAGREGTYLTSRHLAERLERELERDAGLMVEPGGQPDRWRVSGRGELHLSVLIETMRREGYEFAVSRPEVIWRERDGRREEPLELLVMDLPDDAVGPVLEALGPRRGEMRAMTPSGQGRSRLEFLVPSRGLLGFDSQFATLTRGYGVASHTFYGYGADRGSIPLRSRGSLVAWEQGVTTAYALANAEQRGTLFVGPGVEVYEGQIVGENAREGDLDINVCKEKHLTNMRSSTADVAVRLAPPRQLTLEEALEFIREDELVEVTPRAIRLRKAILDREERARLRSGHVSRMEAGRRR
ncbi:MAG: translational GTPase TypA [Bacillota bacterium]|nr:translational GTPase TypA [Bacillota bacterium]